MRLIDADAIFYSDTIIYGKQLVEKATIDRLPTIEAEIVKHGRWEDKPTGAYGRWQSWCSVCGKHSGIGGIESNRHKPYCPNCGARMRTST